jgi:hypothetical protein
MTRRDEKEVLFQGLSLANFQTLSSTSGGGENFGGYSTTGSFTPRRNFDPNAATLVQLNQVVATLIMDLTKGR